LVVRFSYRMEIIRWHRMPNGTRHALAEPGSRSRKAMPELPDVEIFNRLVLEHCRGRTIARTVVSDPGLLQGVSADAVAVRLDRETIRSSVRYGKHLFILVPAAALTMHFGMNGSLHLVPPNGAEPSYTRLRLDFDDGACLAYINPRRFGGVGVCDSVDAFVAQASLGPDVLDDAFDLRAFTARLAGSKRDIKAVLMDQRLMAGLGNIYSDEILFQARIFPGTEARNIRGESAAHLFRATHETLATAVRCGAGAEQAAERLPDDFLLPHRRRGGHCPRCGTALRTESRAGRTGYYCPRCQPS
jgi:formamidopyrimidine-DNA glycosylase